MKLIIITFFLTLNILGHSQDLLNFTNNDFSLNIKYKMINTDSFALSIKIISNFDILIPADICDLQYDTSKIYYDNSWCYPFYFKGLVMNKYKSLQKDSIIYIETKNLNRYNYKCIKFKFIYIKDNNEFKDLKPEIYCINKNGINVYSIEPLFESQLVLSNKFIIKIN
jgi:hypothetical protein